MCTVSYLPLNKVGFLLTSNRDEKSYRQTALPPEKYLVEGREIVFPKDPDAGGTWIASAVKGHTLCLLNGGFESHERQLKYRRSRGLVLLDFFEFNNVEHFCEDYEFEGIEPFTMIIAGLKSLDEFRWTGTRVHWTELDRERPSIWSSVTLYPDEVIRMREEWFAKWLSSRPVFTPENALNFHKTAGTGNPENDVLMNREGDEVSTVSITSVFRSFATEEMIYEDTSSGKQTRLNIS